MNLDLVSVMAMVALVVNVSGVLFIVETIIRRDEGAGRVWSIGFLGGILTTLSYVVWSQMPEAVWPIAVGNATFVAGTGTMWLGARRYNGRRMALPSFAVAAAAVGATVAVVLDPRGGDWAGAEWMFVCLAVFAALGSAECLRDDLYRSRTAWVLAAVLGFQSLYFVARTVAFVVAGPDSMLFQTTFGTVNTGILTVILTIVAVVVTSVLRAARAPVRGYAPVASGAAGARSDGILADETFAAALRDVCDRAKWRTELVGVIAVRIEDLDQISTAFGSEVARAVTDKWRLGVRRHAPATSPVGEDGPTGLLVAVVAETPLAARRTAAAIYRGLFDDLGQVGGGVIPVVGVGVGLSDTVGYDAEVLTRVARDAAVRAAASVESSVLVGDDG